jgi:hypothetical protein
LDDSDGGNSNTIVDSGTSGTDTIVLGTGSGTYRVQGDFSAADGIEIIDGSSATGDQLGTRDSQANFDFTDVTLVGVDEIIGTSNNDTIVGSGGNDTVSSGAGDDVLSGGVGDDLLSGGTGNDTLRGEEGADLLQGGEGNDTMELSGDTTWSGYNAHNTETGDLISLTGKTRNSDVFVGDEGEDTIVGTDQADAIFLDDSISDVNSAASGARRYDEQHIYI